MGAVYPRFDYSPVIGGLPDSDGRALSSMQVVEYYDYYFLFIYISTTAQVFNVPFIEYPTGGNFYINGNNPAPQDIDVCIIDSYKACPTLIKSVTDSSTGLQIPLSRIYFENPGVACYTYRYRLGSLITDASSSVVTQTAENGFKCRISVRDYKETAMKEQSCCSASHINFANLNANQSLAQIYEDFTQMSIAESGSCPMTFSNGFSTDHCDDYMNTFCAVNANTEPCIMFMLAQIARNKATLKTFVDYCSSNLSDRVCLFMAIFGREMGMSEAPDRALRNYCNNNTSDKKCSCYNTTISLPKSFTQNAYIGPIACWYKPCAEETNTQFLLTEQLKQRKGCAITRCSIDVGNINLQSTNPSLITLINDCQVSLQNITKIPKAEKTFFSDPIWKIGYMGLLGTSLASISLLIPLALRK